MNIPVSITLSRLFLSPVICLCLLSQGKFLFNCGLCLLLVTSLTDYLDGYIARKTNSQSELGKFLDPLADKMLVLLSFFACGCGGYVHSINVIPVILILFREIVLLGFRQYASQEIHVLSVTPLARWKTTCQIASIFCLLLFHRNPFLSGCTALFLWMTCALTLWTGFMYFLKARKVFDEEK